MGIKSWIHILQREKSADHQPRPCQQHNRQSKFGAYQHDRANGFGAVLRWTRASLPSEHR